MCFSNVLNPIIHAWGR